MYGIALSVSTCLRAGTRVDVAWIVDRQQAEPSDPNEAVAITPRVEAAWGRSCPELSTVSSSKLAGVQSSQGRLFKLDVGPGDAAIAVVEPVAGIGCLLVPGSELPDELWQQLLDREPVCLVSHLDGEHGQPHDPVHVRHHHRSRRECTPHVRSRQDHDRDF